MILRHLEFSLGVVSSRLEEPSDGMFQMSTPWMVTEVVGIVNLLNKSPTFQTQMLNFQKLFPNSRECKISGRAGSAVKDGDLVKCVNEFFELLVQGKQCMISDEQRPVVDFALQSYQ